LTKAKRDGRGSSGFGAVSVRPIRLPLPAPSTKRYQYSCAADRWPTSTRQVQSDASCTRADVFAITRVNAASSATSTSKLALLRPSAYGRRVQSRTLFSSGSPDATPCGYRSRRSRQPLDDGRTAEQPQASEAPS